MRWFAAALVLALAGCGPVAEAPRVETQVQDEIRVENAWAAPTPGGVAVSAGYLTIINGTGARDRLVAASSPRAARVEIHDMAMQDGVMQMRPMEALAIAPGGRETLAPGGRHLMFFGVTQPFVEDETIPVRLTFEVAGELDISLPVRRPGARESSHESH
jgi:periplasmic copper chaperone A